MNRLPSSEDDEELSHGGSAPPRKKLRLTREQSRLLEDSFRQNHTLNPVNHYSHYKANQNMFNLFSRIISVRDWWFSMFFVKCRNKRKHLQSIWCYGQDKLKFGFKTVEQGTVSFSFILFYPKKKIFLLYFYIICE